MTTAIVETPCLDTNHLDTRRERLLEIAATVFVARGLHATTTALLAERAGITEALLYAYFENKGEIFRESVERSMTNRRRILERQIESISSGSLVQSVEKMAEATVGICVSDAASTLLMNWALLEAPEYASDLYRCEVGSLRLIWERSLARRFARTASLAVAHMRVLPYTIQACLAYGSWLAVLRHCPASAAPMIRAFAEGIGRAASTLIPE